jgi:uncharacterized membrane protein
VNFPILNSRRRWIAAAILVLALAVRVWDLTARSLWFDEANEYWVSTAPFTHLVESVRTGTGDPPLYEFVLHFWMKYGESEAWLRTLSVLASVSGVAGVMVLTELVAGSTAAVCAGIMLALLPADIRYAQEVGQYGVVPAVVAWNLVCLVLMMRERTWRTVLGWAGTALGASYLYYGTIFPIASAFACVVVECIVRRDARTRRATGTALVLYIIGMLPLVIWYLPTQMARVVSGPGVSSSLTHNVTGVLQKKWQLACELLAFQFSGWPHTHIPPALVVVPAMFLMVVAIWRTPRTLIWFAVTINVCVAADALGVFPVGYRWGLTMTPLIICAIAAAVVAPRRAWLHWAAIAGFALLVAVDAYSLPNRSLRDRVYKDASGAWPETEDMRGIAQFWQQQRSASDPTYVYYGAAPAFAYYTRDIVKRNDLPSTWCLPCWHDRNPPPYCHEANVYYGRWMRNLDQHQMLASIAETLGGGPPTLWLVFGHKVPGDDRFIIGAFQREGYRVVAGIEGVNASACLLTRTK